MKFKNLTEENKDLIRFHYENSTKEYAQGFLAGFFGVSERTIRGWANKLELNVLPKNRVSSANVMIYDIETSQIVAKVFWTGKQYVGFDKLKTEPKIISISWKWLGEDKVHYLTWDKDHSDKQMLVDFLPEYNKADMVIGVNNDNFDNRWINARAAKYRLQVNTMIRSFDIQKEFKRLFRIPSYSMKYAAKFFGLDQQKQQHEGIIMWDMIEDGTPDQQKEYLKKMVDYNIQDILTTEDLYLSLRQYMGHKMHLGVFDDKAKYTCPNCGGNHIKLYQTQVTPAGTVQRVMQCENDQTLFKLTNKLYLQYLENNESTN
jgi:uncharacterized protein YprB with RNaseH-like and TPR domain